MHVRQFKSKKLHIFVFERSFDCFLLTEFLQNVGLSVKVVADVVGGILVGVLGGLLLERDLDGAWPSLVAFYHSKINEYYITLLSYDKTKRRNMRVKY